MFNKNKNISKLIIFLLISSILIGCSDEKKPISIATLALLSLGGGQVDNRLSATSTPAVSFPSEVQAENQQISRSNIPAPEQIDNSWVPIGPVMNIGPENQKIIFQEGNFAKIEYTYDPSILASQSLVEDFNVFYFDSKDGKWKPVEEVTIDQANHKFTALVSHLTPFVPAALLYARSNITSPPACLSADFPNGIEGSSNSSARFMTVDENLKIYRDSSTRIMTDSLENEMSFEELGLGGSLGISTCNGCKAPESHRLFAGQNYINFKAHMDLDVFLMYDTRAGGKGKNGNLSNDPSWIASKGFVNTGFFVQTTSRYYRVYKKSYNKNEIVSLDGNFNNKTRAISNYWLALKQKGIKEKLPLTAFCVKNPVPNKPVMQVTSSSAIYENGSGFEFPTTRSRSRSKWVKFEIQNLGGKALNLIGNPTLKLIGENADEFILTELKSPIRQNRNGKFSIRFAPKSLGKKKAELLIQSDDPERTNFKIYLSGTGTIPANLITKGIQSVTLPANAPPQANQRQISEITAPPVINDMWIPIGDVYDLGPKDSKIEFGAGNFAKIQYKYDSARLQANGLPEEFNVMYFENGVWKPVDKITVDYSKKIITAYTSHFTPFVPVVVLPTAGFTTPPPACISADFPAGIAGNTPGSAEFMLVDENFKYYKDRNYIIKPFASSPDNAATFAALGFSGAMGIATCNGGGTNGCGSQPQNKLYTGTNYINFTAHMNLDVYLMYDTRGGGGRNLNTSNDAPWIAAQGFVNTGYYIETDDAVQFYRVYKKTINQGDLLTLDGNRRGVPSPGGDPIQTNYWVILKRAGVTTVGPATA